MLHQDSAYAKVKIFIPAPVEAKQTILHRLQWDSENETTPKDAFIYGRANL